MFYLKHPTLGNRHAESRDEANKLQREGWTLWPRSKEQKLGLFALKPAETISDYQAIAPAIVPRNTLKLRQPK